MAKKKLKNIANGLNISSIEGGENAYLGTPTMVLLPARNYCFKVINPEVKVTIPRKGKYNDLDKEFFSEKEGRFDVYDEKNKVMYMPSISKILFGLKKYPDLKANQLFAPVALVFNNKTVEILGQVIEMLDPPSDV